MVTREPAPRVQSAVGLASALAPRSIAVVGASPHPASVGHRLFANILAHGFTGSAFPVHPTAKDILGHPAFPTVGAIPDAVDLAILAVPADQVLKVAVQCADKGVKSLVVVSAGFRETGAEGATMEQDLGSLARRRGLRVIGPNCLGIVNADPAVRLHAIFAESPADGGPVALMTQSGALGIALLDRAHRLGLGIGRFVSMGNKVDVSGNDLLLHWQADPGVRVIAMHLESIGNPRSFVRIARAVTRSKPILLVKGGRTAEGAKAAGSHTGAMVDPDGLVDAMVAQSGAVRVTTVEEMFDAALALSLQPPLQGNRIAIVTNSGGPAILLTDALPGAGLRPAVLSAKTLAACAARLPAGAALANPLDMLAGAGPETLRACLADLLEDGGVDAVVAMVTPLATDDLPWAEAILDSARRANGKPLVAVLFGRDAGSAGFRHLVRGGVPAYTFPENAARALGVLRQVAVSSATPPEVDAAPPLRQRPPQVAPGAAGWATTAEAMRALGGIGLRFPAVRRCANPHEAAAAAAEIGFPVALKVEAQGLVHKTEAGAVRLGLAGAEEVQREGELAWGRVKAAGFPPTALLVQQMAPPGLELIVGAVRDPKFGPVVSVGAGGVYTEALRDVAVALAPVTGEEAERMLSSLRIRPLFEGLRGEAPRDVAALRDAVVAMGRFIADNPEVQEVEANPVRVLAAGHGLMALDARLRLAGA